MAASPGEVIFNQLGKADHGGEDVVEVMGDAAGEGADSLHLLRLAELLLEPLPFNGVPDGTLEKVGPYLSLDEVIRRSRTHRLRVDFIIRVACQKDNWGSCSSFVYFTQQF